jgi:hypothetical protein
VGSGVVTRSGTGGQCSCNGTHDTTTPTSTEEWFFSVGSALRLYHMTDRVESSQWSGVELRAGGMK